ncbi:MAG: DUF2207 domain-containing protein, partial [Bacilli bacterium]|nr:DUF2207 domain-containing protein [Bacilli bacterium]
MKKLFLSLFLVCLLIPTKVFAYDYEITSYDVNMVVNLDNTFDITEKITAQFNIPKHGIHRYLPLRNTINREDGTSSKNRARITDIQVDTTYTTYQESSNKVIKIGDADILLNGLKDYTISYTYGIGKDPLKEKDELYYNLIGTSWDTTISNFTFSIQMPKEFDEAKIGFSVGEEGSINFDDISYSVNEKTITGVYNGILAPGEAFTIRLELPNDYFVVTDNYLLIILSLVLPLILFFISFYLWYKYGKEDDVIETVEFYPPEGYNSAEVGYLYKGYNENNSIISLIVYLANKGYLKINEIETK